MDLINMIKLHRYLDDCDKPSFAALSDGLTEAAFAEDINLVECPATSFRDFIIVLRASGSVV